LIEVEILLGYLQAPADVHLAGSEGKFLIGQADRRIGIWKGLDELLNEDS